MSVAWCFLFLAQAMSLLLVYLDDDMECSVHWESVERGRCVSHLIISEKVEFPREKHLDIEAH